MRYDIEVTASGMIPAVIYAGPEGQVGQSIKLTFSDDWGGLDKYIQFFTLRGQEIIVPYAEEGAEVFIPAEISMWGGPSRFTVKGVSIDEFGYIETRLAVTGTIFTTYTPGHNPRLTGKLTPNTVELYLAQAAAEMRRQIQEAKDSGEFDGADGEPGGFGTITASAQSVDSDDPAEASVIATGPNAEKNLLFTFKIPVGDSGVWVSDSDSEPPSADQNLWARLESGDNFLWIADGFVIEDGRLYLAADGTKFGNGVVVGGSGGTIIVDTAMSNSSTNAVQNSVIKAYVDGQIETAISGVSTLLGQINNIVGVPLT